MLNNKMKTMKLSKKTEASIISQVNAVADAYAVFEALSVKLGDKMDKYNKIALKNQDRDLISRLIDLTCPVDKHGQVRHGEFVRRIYLYMTSSEIDAKLKKKKPAKKK